MTDFAQGSACSSELRLYFPESLRRFRYSIAPGFLLARRVSVVNTSTLNFSRAAGSPKPAARNLKSAVHEAEVSLDHALSTVWLSQSRRSQVLRHVRYESANFERSRN